MSTPDFFTEYKGRDNYELRIFLALLKNKTYGYALAKKFRTYHIFSTELILPNKITSHIKKMRDNGSLTSANQGKKIIVEANRDILKQMADKQNQYKIDEAIEMLSYAVKELELAYQPNIKTFRDCLDAILHSLWGIFLNEKSLYPYFPIVSILFYMPNIREKEKLDSNLSLSTERWDNLITIPKSKKAQKSNNFKNYLMKHKDYLKDFLFLIADCLEKIELRYLTEKGTHYLELRLLVFAQIGATKRLLNSLEDNN